MSPPESDHSQEVAITRVLHERFRRDDCLQPGDRESVAYRIAEIMVASKNLYLDSLPRLLEEVKPEHPTSAFEELAGLRMTLLHLRDLVTDFDEAFMEAMAHQREEDETETED